MYYIVEVMKVVWPVALIMGMVSIPILFIIVKESKQYESIEDFYDTGDFDTKDNSIDLIDGSTHNLND